MTTEVAPPALFDRLPAIRERVADAEGMLFCTDFDGTLAGIETDPDAPAIGSDNRVALERLRDHDRVRVAVISGRELADLRERVGIEGIDYAGNHGLELHKDGETTVHPVAERRRRDLGGIVADIEERLAGTDCFVEDKSVSATVHYRTAPERRDEVHDAVESAVGRVAPGKFELSTGKDIVELTPAVAWDKGDALLLLDADHDGWLPIYIGDDTTDEAAFRALAGIGIGVHVGPGTETAADYRIESPEEVTRFLDWLAHEGLDALGAAES
ncbi:trehalose-phosphatase [Halococcus sp. AFM35]|uniref:trehalose-phosphatase n=1 Tax=Halococcus sp. AFM35 TaxID=3421653 RepID=UPI003EBB61E6